MRDLSRGVKECNTPEALFSYKRLSKICMYTLSPLRVSSVSRHKLIIGNSLLDFEVRYRLKIAKFWIRNSSKNEYRCRHITVPRLAQQTFYRQAGGGITTTLVGIIETFLCPRRQVIITGITMLVENFLFHRRLG